MSIFRDTLVKLKHRSKTITYLWYISRKPKFFLEENKIKYESARRSKGFDDHRFLDLKQYKNFHKGERCFIVATGPSLTITDIEMLKDEYTFGMNSICKVFNSTNWRPTYYGIQDPNIYEKMESSIMQYYKNAENVFVADIIVRKFLISKCFHQFPLDRVYHDNELELDKYFVRFSDNCYSIVYDGYSITYSLIQIAVYMGFKEIYLLGTDCSYKKGERNHFVESGFVDKNEEKNYEKMITGYQVAKEYSDAHNIKIVNCTRGGMLEVFPRMTLEDVLK